MFKSNLVNQKDRAAIEKENINFQSTLPNIILIKILNHLLDDLYFIQHHHRLRRFIKVFSLINKDFKKNILTKVIIYSKYCIEKSHNIEEFLKLSKYITFSDGIYFYASEKTIITKELMGTLKEYIYTHNIPFHVNCNNIENGLKKYMIEYLDDVYKDQLKSIIVSRIRKPSTPVDRIMYKSNKEKVKLNSIESITLFPNKEITPYQNIIDCINPLTVRSLNVISQMVMEGYHNLTTPFKHLKTLHFTTIFYQQIPLIATIVQQNTLLENFDFSMGYNGNEQFSLSPLFNALRSHSSITKIIMYIEDGNHAEISEQLVDYLNSNKTLTELVYNITLDLDLESSNFIPLPKSKITNQTLKSIIVPVPIFNIFELWQNVNPKMMKIHNFATSFTSNVSYTDIDYTKIVSLFPNLTNLIIRNIQLDHVNWIDNLCGLALPKLPLTILILQFDDYLKLPNMNIISSIQNSRTLVNLSISINDQTDPLDLFKNSIPTLNFVSIKKVKMSDSIAKAIWDNRNITSLDISFYDFPNEITFLTNLITINKTIQHLTYNFLTSLLPYSDNSLLPTFLSSLENNQTLKYLSLIPMPFLSPYNDTFFQLKNTKMIQ
ncbi:apoptosis inducing factor [Tieghemostelium lacteum]|uniref:Apoptosis inducing factor n=1 Tax=Tieghemostelium lacteum TaxID=361077 RepID=A0A152A9I9_TIELA|nr:apoptosis inducing factor [Tieghemostelium lacteum]|eukprot:KYR02892.1 apoptosis inducing factor [Tieghemostelium lacteum]